MIRIAKSVRKRKTLKQSKLRLPINTQQSTQMFPIHLQIRRHFIQKETHKTKKEKKMWTNKKQAQTKNEKKIPTNHKRVLFIPGLLN